MNDLITQNVPLAAHTTLQVGGPADYWAQVRTSDELEQALQFAKQTAMPVFVLGSGSNVLFSDAGYRGLVIQNAVVGQRVTPTAAGALVRVGAGENWDTLVADMCAAGYWGMENLSAIPGTVGATPIQNVGAYGVEVSQLIESVEAIEIDTLQHKTFTAEECQFAYRDSYFKSPAGRRWAVVAVTFELSSQAQPKLHYADLQPLQERSALSASQIRQEVIQIRAGKFPDWTQVGTAGSFFKNPIVSAEHYEQLRTQYPDLPAHQTATGEWKLSLGWILDKVCGLRGYCVGAVCLYQNQALVLTSAGESAQAVIDFVAEVRQLVQEKTGVGIEPEVRVMEG